MIRVFLDLLDLDPSLFCTDLNPDPDPSIIEQKEQDKDLFFYCFMTL